jgi:hypothetical protein
MRARWLIGDYADAEFRLTRAQRRDISRVAQERFVPGGSFVRFTLIAVLPPVVVAFVALRPLMGWLGFAGKTGPWMIALGVILLLFWPWSAWAYVRLYAPA